MTDQNDQNNSYVSSYAPPVPGGDQTVSAVDPAHQAPAQDPAPKADPYGGTPQYLKDMVANNQTNPTPQAPPAPQAAPTPAPAPQAVPTAAPSTPASDTAAASDSSQSLEEQNIFDLLGVSDGTDEEKESFLDELQQVIWEDFLENDVPLLVTLEERNKVEAIIAKENQPEVEKQEELVVYLEALIPELEEIMLEKALELKEDMVRERIKGMREYYANNQEALNKIDEAEVLTSQDKWAQVAIVLNAIQ